MGSISICSRPEPDPAGRDCGLLVGLVLSVVVELVEVWGGGGDKRVLDCGTLVDGKGKDILGEEEPSMDSSWVQSMAVGWVLLSVSSAPSLVSIISRPVSEDERWSRESRDVAASPLIGPESRRVRGPLMR